MSIETHFTITPCFCRVHRLGRYAIRIPNYRIECKFSISYRFSIRIHHLECKIFGEHISYKIVNLNHLILGKVDHIYSIFTPKSLTIRIVHNTTSAVAGYRSNWILISIHLHCIDIWHTTTVTEFMNNTVDSTFVKRIVKSIIMSS